MQRYVEDWTALTARSGVWIDTDDAYWTLSNDYIESVWWLVRQMWDKGLLYEGHRVTPVLRPLRHRAVVPRGRPARRLPRRRRPLGLRALPAHRRRPDGADADLLVWTTTPWTLISNVAAAVGPDIDYVRVADPDGGRDLVAGRGGPSSPVPRGARSLERSTGADLVGRHYQRPVRRPRRCDELGA